jgi:hypothetical protein
MLNRVKEYFGKYGEIGFWFRESSARPLQCTDVSAQGRFSAWTFQRTDVSAQGRFSAWNFQRTDVSAQGRFSAWTFQRMDVSAQFTCFRLGKRIAQ